MIRALSRIGIVAAASIACFGLGAQSSAPVELEVKVDLSAFPSTGRATAQLAFQVSEDIGDAYSVRFEVRADRETVLRRDHAPPTPTRRWRKGQTVRYALPLALPADHPRLTPGMTVSVWAGLVDGDRRIVPLTGARRDRNDLIRVGEFEYPGVAETLDVAAVEAAIVAAESAARAGNPTEAWDRLEFAFRRIDDYPLKSTLRDALLKVGTFAPPPLTFEEQAIVDARISSERRRYLRQVSGRMYDRGELHGALMILDVIGGELSEAGDQAVIGALNDAERVSKDRADIEEKITRTLSEAQKQTAQALIAELGDTDKLLDKAHRLAKSGERAVARRLMHYLSYSGSREIGARAALARDELDKAWLADIPHDQKQRAEAALHHACWSRTEAVVSHRFVFIGPRTLVRGIPRASSLNFDLAYLYLTDLFGRVPNPGGDRVTVYFKELWEFGGGVGGGKTIDIGSADPNRTKTEVDTKLLYHELTHCVDDTRPVYAGFREGLADFGATFVACELGGRGRARADIGLHYRAFEQDYLRRDLEYWRIPNYGPSAGFLLYFMTEYGKGKHGFEWQRYRKFFRDYRACEVRDARATGIARAFAFHLVAAFGESAFKDLQRFRWPLIDSDLEAIRLEQQAARDGVAADVDLLKTFEGSPVPRDIGIGDLVFERGVDRQRYEDFAGIVQNWRVIGPFKRAGVGPDGFAFPPEYEIDFDRRYPLADNQATWCKPGDRPQVQQRDSGWVVFDYAYMDNTAIYALTHVTAPEAMDAFAHVRTDDDATLFVNDDLIGKFRHSTGEVGPWHPGRRTSLPDAIRFPIHLEKGRNKILLKIHNRYGGSGCSLAIANRNGLAIPGVRSDADPPKQVSARFEASDVKKWPKRFGLTFNKSAAARKLETTVGKFRVDQKALVGTSDDRGVEWRKYTVRPGFPKDSPSNLAWLKERETKGIGPFFLGLDLDCRHGPPKLCVMFQGEGRRDALSGWTLVLTPHYGRDEFRVRAERYDRLVYGSDWVKIDKETEQTLSIQLEHERLTVRYGDATILDQVPIRSIPGMHRIGIAHWGDRTRITSLELRAPRRTR